MANLYRSIRYPNRNTVLLIHIPQNASDNPLTPYEELIIMLDDEIVRLKKTIENNEVELEDLRKDMRC
jgi:hypothetical protein